MIKQIEITNIHMDSNPEVTKYVKKKIAKLDSYMPKHARKSAHAEVRLKESKSKDKKTSTCEVTLHVPNEQIMATESTVNMYAAIDIVEEKLKTQLRKYKDRSDVTKTHGETKIRRMFGKIVGRN
ncbi:ribosome-associated translation inhibitor RaiA [Candidatus Saccharibacteria bacterium]|nr:ribosome-associated translation inhibitor RaiA [Candidatus Saccharibacteria bacterium]MDQ5885450.1 putative sigma-54 modulation protein [Patescibacteria group bacterium]MDQ5953390.1 putative sigma-54 modulation protein [Patescibacteria group bacterium]MDQ5958709.1 putative sigma-54 modulation protein [Patescibacteria group bacterium]